MVESIYKNSIFIFSNIFMWKEGCHLTSLKVIRDVGKCPCICKGAESDEPIFAITVIDKHLTSY